MKALADDVCAALLEAAPDAIVCVTADGRIAAVNAQAERLFGYRPAELDGQPVEILVPDAVRDLHRQHRSDYLADPRPRAMGARGELTGLRRDGSTFPAEISLSAIQTGDGILIAAAVRDVTERLAARAELGRIQAKAERDRLMTQLYRSQRLESLGQLVGGVIHDFNNLLGVISSYATFISEEAAKDPPVIQWDAIRADIQQVHQAARRASDLIHQLLSFARPGVVQPRVLNLNGLVAGLEPMLRRTLGENVELVTRLAADLGPVLADRGQIEQVLVNLAVNARDAMPAGGTLTIETANARADQADAARGPGPQPGRHVCVKVSDTGTGIADEIIDRVFEPFFTTKPKGQGSGLGLANVREVVTQAGGTVRIGSQPGAGTTVTVMLPLTDRTAVPAQRPPRELSGGRGEVVLVVEDQPALREVIRRMLDRSGYLVLAAGSGDEAVSIVTGQQAHVDVLLTDVIMPKMLGREVADRIRALQPGVKVLFMSGYSLGLLGARGVLEPGVSLIEKPFSEASLLTKLRHVLAAPAT